MSSTKIVVTVGPSCDTIDKLSALIKEGVSVFRFNLKHNSQKWHSLRILRLNKAAKKVGIPVATLLDFQGPEVRIGAFKEGKLLLEKGETVYFTVKEGTTSGKEILINNFELLQRLTKGQKIFIDGGAFEFEVIKNKENIVSAKVIEGGILTSKKNVNIPGLELPLPTLAKKDLEDIALAARTNVDYVALSYVRSPNDIKIFRQELQRQKVRAQIIAKIETRKAMENIDKIIEEADGIMVARGDLGVEFPLEEVPYYQKKIIKKCLQVGKPVITATQMLESMIENPQPTRAEVSDVANAIYDHTDAVMLSAESAIGKYPQKAVSIMRKIAEFTEKKLTKMEDFEYDMRHQTAAVTYGAYQLLQSEFCQRVNIKALVVLTETGTTARMLSRLRPAYPIIALTRHKDIADKLCLLWGVIPVVFDFIPYERKKARHIAEILGVVKKKKFVKSGEKVVMIYGEDWGTPGKTSVIRIQEVM